MFKKRANNIPSLGCGEEPPQSNIGILLSNIFRGRFLAVADACVFQTSQISKGIPRQG